MNAGAPEGSRPSGRSNLSLRVISALVLGIAVLAVTIVGGLPFRLFAIVVAALVFQEWMAMRKGTGRFHAAVARSLLAIVLAVVLAGLPPLVLILALGAAVLVAAGHAAHTGSGLWSAAGIAYAGAPAAALSLLRGADEAGLVAVLFLFAVVWASDIFAYFTGRALGGPKLAPSISPGKTWSGAVGGALGAVIAGVAVLWAASAALSPLPAALLALVLSVVSQAGDLFESALKRRHGVKDSGTLIPGHGGVMDRVDGLVAAAVLLYLLGALYSGASTPAAGFFSR